MKNAGSTSWFLEQIQATHGTSHFPGIVAFSCSSAGWQMVCISKYLWFAAALNRTLLLPRYGAHSGVERGGYRWRWDVILDVAKMRRCLQDCGPSKAPRVMTVDELLQIPPNETYSLHTVRNVSCEDNPKLKSWNCSQPLPDRGCVFLEKVFAPSKNSIAYVDAKDHSMSSICPFNGSQVVLGPTPKLTWDLLEEVRKLARNHSVISLGSIFYEEVGGTPGYDFFRGKGPSYGPFNISEDCGYLLSPVPAIIDLANKAIQHCSGDKPFAAVHIRRYVQGLLLPSLSAPCGLLGNAGSACMETRLHSTVCLGTTKQSVPGCLVTEDILKHS